MRFLSLFSFCVFVVFATACQRHPLPGDPQPGLHEENSAETPGAETHDAKTPEHPEPARPVESGKPGEAPKFFPEKK